MSKYDKRRARYVPLDVFVAFDEFGSKLVEKWGMEGLCCWMLLLAAAKREVTQGLFTYTSEEEAWSKLGAKPAGLTLDEFLTYTGRCKKTRKTRQGRITYVQLRMWDKWNTRPAYQQNPRSEQENTDGLHENARGIERNVRAEGEVELEVEDEKKAFAVTSIEPPARNGSSTEPTANLENVRRIKELQATIGKAVDG